MSVNKWNSQFNYLSFETFTINMNHFRWKICISKKFQSFWVISNSVKISSCFHSWYLWMWHENHDNLIIFSTLRVFGVLSVMNDRFWLNEERVIDMLTSKDCFEEVDLSAKNIVTVERIWRCDVWGGRIDYKEKHNKIFCRKIHVDVF